MTSSTSKSLPSLKVTPWRSWNVTVSPSSLTSHDSASPGPGVSSESNSISEP